MRYNINTVQTAELIVDEFEKIKQGIPMGWVKAILLLARSDEISIPDLSKKINLTNKATAEMVTQLEIKNIVSVWIDPNDGRRTRQVSLGSEGAKMFRTIEQYLK